MSTSQVREQLAREVAGSVHDGEDAAGVAEAAGFNTAVRHRPAVVVAAAGPADVAAAVRHAARAGLRVEVQATGHGAAAAGPDTVLVSTKGMQGVRVDPHARVARVEAGTRWRAVIDAAVSHGLAPLSGSSSGVGVVGYTLGGGMGHLGRRHGFAADRVRAVELVTADGEITTVTADSDPELFWAVRGGQGRFGVVTALELDLVPVPDFYGGAMLFLGPAVPDVLHRWAEWAPTLQEEATTSVALLRLPPTDDVPPPLRGTVSLAVRFGLAGPTAWGERLLAPMRAAGTPLLDSVAPLSYAEVDRIHMDPTQPMPAFTRGGLLGSLPTDAVDALLGVAGPDVEVPLAVAELRLMGGALARPAAVPNAVAGRDGAFSLCAIAPAPPPLAAVAPGVTAGVVGAMSPWSTGTSLANFAAHGDDPATIWAPDVLARLAAVKRAVDPGHLFGGALTGADAALAGAR